MKRSYIFSNNKENQSFTDKPLLKLQINYQDRQRYYQKSKSPLREQALNHIYQNNYKNNTKSPVRKNQINTSLRYLQEPEVQQLIMLTPNANMVNRQSSSDLSQIKPLSLNTWNRRALDKDSTNKLPNNVNGDRKVYAVPSKARVRQNSKQLQFIQKVSNLEKINNQISSLLSYAYENKTAKEDKNIQQKTSTYKAKYEPPNQNTKLYQRRFQVLQKPIQNQPKISKLEAQQDQDDQMKRQLNSNKFKYSNDNILSQNPSATINLYGKNHYQQENSKSIKRRFLSPKFLDISERNIYQQPPVAQKNATFHQSKHILIPSQSEQKISQITINQNPDLQFYYQSLKKRDEQIGRFKNKNFNLIENIITKNNDQHQDDKLTRQLQQIKAPENKNGNNFPNSHVMKGSRGDSKNIQQSLSKKDLYVTQQQIQVYKDLSRLNSNHRRMSSIQSLQGFSKKKEKTSQQLFIEKQNKQTVSKVQRKSQRSLLRQQSLQSYRCSQGKNIETDHSQQANRLQNAVTFKLDEQIKRIKDQLKYCKRQKSHLSKRYENFLQNYHQQKTGNQKDLMNQRGRYILANLQPEDDLRMFDQKQIFIELPVLKLETGQRLGSQLRSRLQRQNLRKKQDLYLGNSHKDQKPVGIQPNPYKQSGRHTPTGGRTPKPSSALKTPRSFEIQLKKVQVTKPETTRLSTLLAEKIQIDLRLSQQRENFATIKNSNKWNQIKNHLQTRYNFIKSEHQWQKLLSISTQERNPFSPTQQSCRQSPNKFSSQFRKTSDTSFESLSRLCSLYSKSVNYFESNILHRFSSQLMNKQHFSLRELDLSFKGYLSLQDLVCFVNLHSGKFYRNRDIIFTIKYLLLQHGNLKQIQGKQQHEIKQNSTSSGGSNHYKLAYQFLWAILTEQINE